MTYFKQQAWKTDAGTTWVITECVPGVVHCLMVLDDGRSFRGQGRTEDAAIFEAQTAYSESLKFYDPNLPDSPYDDTHGQRQARIKMLREQGVTSDYELRVHLDPKRRFFFDEGMPDD